MIDYRSSRLRKLNPKWSALLRCVNQNSFLPRDQLICSDSNRAGFRTYLTILNKPPDVDSDQ